MPNHGINWPFMPKPQKPRPSRGRERLQAFGIHFVLGAILGSVFGLGIWAFHLCRSESAEGGRLCIAFGALLGGLIAGIARDRFWGDLGQKPKSR